MCTLSGSHDKLVLEWIRRRKRTSSKVLIPAFPRYNPQRKSFHDIPEAPHAIPQISNAILGHEAKKINAYTPPFFTNQNVESIKIKLIGFITY